MRKNTIIASFLIGHFCLALSTLSAQNDKRAYTDHHVHLQDSATVQLGSRLSAAIGQKPSKIDSLILNADTIIRRLDLAGFTNAWIISNAYWFGSPLTPVDNEYAEVKKQNDWIAAEARKYPDRLIAFMSINPLKDYAVDEIKRCANNNSFKGIKLHFANSRIDLENPQHLKKVQEVFRTANQYGLTMLVHFRNKADWDGTTDARIFLKEIFPLLRDTKLVLAHMGGWGGFDKPTIAAAKVFQEFINQNPEAGKKLFFDISAVLTLQDQEEPTTNEVTQLMSTLKKIGINHIVFGSDWPLTDIKAYTKKLREITGRKNTIKILSNKVF